MNSAGGCEIMINRFAVRNARLQEPDVVYKNFINQVHYLIVMYIPLYPVAGVSLKCLFRISTECS